MKIEMISTTNATIGTIIMMRVLDALLLLPGPAKTINLFSLEVFFYDLSF
jgi:hypothetical protein